MRSNAKNRRAPAAFDPSEKYEGSEHLHIPLSDEPAAQVRNIHEAANPEVDANALENPEDVFCYFARMTDANGKLTKESWTVEWPGAIADAQPSKNRT